MIVNNKKKKKIENLPNSVICRSGWPQAKTEENEKRDKYVDLTREL